MEETLQRHAGRIVTVLVILGLGLRTYHYVSDPPMWHDEAAQVVNVLEKSIPDFQGPLYYAEASPPLFMWQAKAFVLGFGDSTFAFRFLPWLASCLALIGMATLGRRLLPSTGWIVLTLLFAFSDRLLWHCCEAKPYALDVLLSVGMLGWLFAEGVFHAGNDFAPHRLVRLLLLLAVISPWLVFLSFPACFVLGGTALCLVPLAWRRRSWGVSCAYASFGLALLGAFLLLLLGPIRAQHGDILRDCWSWNNPDWSLPWLLPLDLLRRVSEVLRYASEPVGLILTPLAALGGWVLWRQGQRTLVTFLTAPLALNVVAWLLGRYPLGPLRVNAYLAPLVLTLVAAGCAPLCQWLRHQGRHLALAPVAALLLLPIGLAGYRLVVPWLRLDSVEAVRLVLARRQHDEPVVGTLWEHRYYFRGLKEAYRDIHPQPVDPPTLPATQAVSTKNTEAPTFARRLWLVANHRDLDPTYFFQSLTPPGAWTVRERHAFRSVTVFYLQRDPEGFAER